MVLTKSAFAALVEVPDPVPSQAEIKAEATIRGHQLMTGIALQPKSNYTSGPSIQLTIESVVHSHKVRERQSAPLGIKEIETLVLETVARILADISERENNLKAHERKQARKRALVPAFVAAASQFLAIWSEYERKHAEWLATEQSRIWQPWNGYEIRIVPLGQKRGDDEEANGYETLLVLEHPLEIAEQLTQKPMAEVTVIGTGGHQTKEWIGGLLRANPVTFDKPGYTYHR